MRHAVKTNDGVAITTLYPIAVTKNGETEKVIRINEQTIFCETFKIDSPIPLEDLLETSIPGLTFVFTKIEREISKWKEKDKVISTRIIKSSTLPQDRTFRDAWVDTGKIEHDMAKCKAIAKAKLSPDKAAAIDAATTPDELKALWPKGPAT